MKSYIKNKTYIYNHTKMTICIRTLPLFQNVQSDLFSICTIVTFFWTVQILIDLLINLFKNKWTCILHQIILKHTYLIHVEKFTFIRNVLMTWQVGHPYRCVHEFCCSVHEFSLICIAVTLNSIKKKMSTKHPWVKRIQVCSNEDPALFQRELITK